MSKSGVHLGAQRFGHVAAALRVARELGPGHTIVTILCDGGAKYVSRLYEQTWLKEKGLFDAAQAGTRAARRA